MIHRRRAQLTGGSTLIVSLPKEWVEKAGVRKADELLLIEQPDDSLFIMVNRPAQQEEAVLEVSDRQGPEDILRLIISDYLAGYEVIKIRFPRAAPTLTLGVKEGIRRWLIGVEIVEETSIGFTAQCLPTHMNLPLKKAIERMGSLTVAMLSEAVDALIEGDVRLADEIVKRDDEVDRFYHLIARQLNMSTLSPIIQAQLGIEYRNECLAYMLATKSIERAADHACLIAKSAGALPSIREGGLTIFEELARRGVDAFKASLRALLNKDTSLANESIGLGEGLAKSLDELVRTDGVRPKLYQTPQFHLILESVRRIGDYASDISEAAINIAVSKPRRLGEI